QETFKGKGIFKGLSSQETFMESMPQDMLYGFGKFEQCDVISRNLQGGTDF
ncbi:17507_t:CDS:1, partial [Cetraspora pellucida]